MSVLEGFQSKWFTQYKYQKDDFHSDQHCTPRLVTLKGHTNDHGNHSF